MCRTERWADDKFRVQLKVVPSTTNMLHNLPLYETKRCSIYISRELSVLCLEDSSTRVISHLAPQEFFSKLILCNGPNLNRTWKRIPHTEPIFRVWWASNHDSARTKGVDEFFTPTPLPRDLHPPWLQELHLRNWGCFQDDLVELVMWSKNHTTWYKN